MQDQYTPIPALTTSDLGRFWSHVDKTDTCWLWTGPKVSGYGKFTVGGRTGKQLRAHRVSYTMARGPIPDGLVLDHLCRNRACVNPDHLEVVTIGENLHRGENVNFLINHGDTCSKGHKLTPDNIYWNPNKRCKSGYARRCRTCMREHEKKRARLKSSSL